MCIRQCIGSWSFAFASLLFGSTALAAQIGARLQATGGVTQIEGAAGGGLVPWALIAGYGTRDQVGGSIFYTVANPSDFTLNSKGVAVGLFDRVELSLAQQRFGLGSTVPGSVIDLDIVGLKVKVAGDAVYDQDTLLPQMAVGLQYKRNRDFDGVPRALGARRESGVDYYFAATKLFLGAIAGRNLLVNGTLRATKANQLGILGFGGDLNDRYRLKFESSVGLFLNDNLLLGVEYRPKPNNLGAFREGAFKDVFVAYFPAKFVALTAAYASFGNIADRNNQSALYLSAQLSF